MHCVQGARAPSTVWRIHERCPVTMFRAGAASLPLEPPLDLPMVGFVRQRQGSQGYGIPLETTALVLERGSTRVVLCGVDIVGIVSPQVEALIERVAAATG